MENKDKLIEDLQKNNADLQKQFMEMQQQMMSFMASNMQKTESNRKVKVIALRPRLTLNTQPHKSNIPNKGYYFDTFGQSIEIPIEDVMSILYLDNQLKHAKNFWFLVDDENVVSQFSGLKQAYDTMPTIKEINNILLCTQKRIKEIIEISNEDFITLLIWRAKEATSTSKSGLDVGKLKLLANAYPRENVMKYFIE